MKIVALVHYYVEENRAGGEMMLHRILKELAKEHDVTALITDTVRLNSVIDGVKVVYAANADTIKTYDYDYVITHFNNADRAFADAFKRGKKAIYIVHNDMQKTLQDLKALRECDIAIFNTKWIRQKGDTKAKSFIIHPPVNLKQFATKPGDHITLVNLTPQKGSDVFYALASRLKDKKFLAVGGGYWKQHQVIQKHPNVTHQENTPNMRDDVFAKTRILLMPSVYESYGMVAREAAASGIPVICTNTPGLIENLGDAGIYVPNKDIDGYLGAIRWLDDETAYKETSEKIKQQVNKLSYADEVSQIVTELRNAAKVA